MVLDPEWISPTGWRSPSELMPPKVGNQARLAGGRRKSKVAFWHLAVRQFEMAHHRPLVNSGYSDLSIESPIADLRAGKPFSGPQ